MEVIKNITVFAVGFSAVLIGAYLGHSNGLKEGIEKESVSMQKRMIEAYKDCSAKKGLMVTVADGTALRTGCAQITIENKPAQVQQDLKVYDGSI